MNKIDVAEYVTNGLRTNSKDSRKQALGPVCLSLLCTFGQGVALGGEWCVVSCIMLAFSMILWIAVVIISKKNTLNSCIRIKAIISTSFYVQVVFTQAFYYAMIRGFDIIMIAICIFPLVIPMYISNKNLRQLKKGIKPVISNNKVKTPLAFGFTGVLGMWFAEILFNNTSQQLAILFVIISFTFVSCVFSVGLTAYQKLYFIKKYSL